MISFISIYYQRVLNMLWEHFLLVFLSVLISFLLAIGISALIRNRKKITAAVLILFIAIYCIPSLALFSFLIPLLGLGKVTAVTALILYNQAYLIRSILSGFDAISPSVREISHSMGLGRFYSLWYVEIPLALPLILNGLKVATVSTSGIAVIASLVDAGGLGVLLFEGMRTHNFVKIVWGILLIASFTLFLNWILGRWEQRASENAKGYTKKDGSKRR